MTAPSTSKSFRWRLACGCPQDLDCIPVLVADADREKRATSLPGARRGRARCDSPSALVRPEIFPLTTSPKAIGDDWTPLQQDGPGAESVRCSCCARRTARSAETGNCLHLAQALLLERGVADGQDLVDDQDLGIQVRRHGEGEPDIHPAGVALHRRVEELFDLGEGDDLVELAGDLARGSCRGSTPLRKIFSRPVSSGWKPVPTSSRLATRPWMSIVPVVGPVIRVRSLSSVLLPAPLRPMIPTTSPGLDLEIDVPERPEGLPLLLAIAEGMPETVG